MREGCGGKDSPVTLGLPDSQQAPGSDQHSPGPERWPGDSRSQVPKHELARVDPLEENPALNPEATASAVPAFSERSSLSPPLPAPPTPLPPVSRFQVDRRLTVHGNLDGPTEAERAEEDSCAGPGWRWPGHPEHRASRPVPRPARSHCLQSLELILLDGVQLRKKI